MISCMSWCWRDTENMIKIKHLLIGSLLCVGLVGCGTVTQKAINVANEFCSEKEGVYKITSGGFIGTYTFYCKNGDETSIGISEVE